MRREKKHILYGLDEDQYSLKGIWLLALLYFGSLIAGAALSLVAFKITHYLDPDASSYLANKAYPKFFDRARWLAVLIILPYLFVQCRVTRLAAVGFARPFASTFFGWFAAGIGMILIIYGFNTLIGAFALREPDGLLRRLDDAVLASLLIAVLEEVVFRGLVFRMFYTAMRPVAAILLSSAFFAILHFKTPEATLGGLTPSEVGIAEAVAIAWGTVAALATEFDLSYLLAIFLVGVFLHQVFLLKGNLWASIGVHAGWVFTIKLFGPAFSTTDAASVFSGTTRVADGYWVSVVLALFIAVFAYRLTQKTPRSDG